MMPVLAHTPVLQTPRLTLRAPVTEDLSGYVEYAASTRTRFVGGPLSTSEAVQKYAAMIGQWVLQGFGRFTLVDRATGKAIGHAGPFRMDHAQAPELTWTLWHSGFEGKGFASEAAQATLHWVFGALGFDAATTLVHRDNAASLRIAKKLGGVEVAGKPSPYGPDFVTYHFIADRTAPDDK